MINLILQSFSFTGQEQGKSGPVDLSSHGAAGSDGLVNLGLFADRRSAYRMFATEGNT